MELMLLINSRRPVNTIALVTKTAVPNIGLSCCCC